MNKKCAVYSATDVMSKRWSLLIILELYKGKTRRYSELKRLIPQITPKILSARLKELQEFGVVSKKVDSSKMPIRCDYSLTKSGEELIKIIKDIKSWSLKWKVNNKLCESQDCKDCDF